MGLKDIIKEIILDNQETVHFTGCKRDTSLDHIKNKAIICIGARRSGKSTLLFQKISEIKKSYSKENILYLNFFDDRLTELRKGNLYVILEAFFSLYPKNDDKLFFFFDELQECNNWESFIDRILRTINAEVYISGSSAKMLSKEIATQMRGRSLTKELFPFSFKEYLNCKSIEYKKVTSAKRFELQNSFDKYFETGGFPEAIDLNKQTRIKVLQEYYKAILHRDIIERFDSLHPKATMHLAFRLLNSISSLYSINRLTQYLKSIGYKISKSFVSDCIDWFEDAFFLFSVKKYDKSISKQNLNEKKIYCIDHALIESVCSRISERKGYLLENMVFIHLRKKTEEIYYYKTNKGKEIDFLWIDSYNNKHLVQVAWDLSDEKTKTREIRSLLDAMIEIKITQAIIVTNDTSDSIVENNLQINIIRAWKYFIS